MGMMHLTISSIRIDRVPVEERLTVWLSALVNISPAATEYTKEIDSHFKDPLEPHRVKSDDSTIRNPVSRALLLLLFYNYPEFQVHHDDHPHTDTSH